MTQYGLGHKWREKETVTDQIPKYRVIAGIYRGQVTSGALEPGSPLPSRRKLAKIHETSRVTIDRVVELLTAEGFLEPSDGNRPPVVADITERIATAQNRVESAAATGRALGEKEISKILRIEEVPCPADIAPLLGVQAGEPVVCRERLNLVDDRPVATGRSYYPPEVTDVTPELRQPISIPSGSRELAAERMGSKQKDIVTLITSRLANDRERELLRLPSPFSVVTQAARRVLLANGKVIEVALKIGEGSRPQSFHTVL